MECDTGPVGHLANDLISDVKTGGSPGCSVRALVEFIALRKMGL